MKHMSIVLNIVSNATVATSIFEIFAHYSFSLVMQCNLSRNDNEFFKIYYISQTYDEILHLMPLKYVNKKYDFGKYG